MNRDSAFHTERVPVLNLAMNGSKSALMPGSTIKRNRLHHHEAFRAASTSFLSNC
jgi:hypothetical protein